MSSKDILRQLVDKANTMSELEKYKDWDKSFQFKVTDGESYNVMFEGGKLSLNDGEVSSPTATINATESVLSDLFEGKLDPIKAFMQGQIKISGDVFNTQKLTSLINKARK